MNIEKVTLHYKVYNKNGSLKIVKSRTNESIAYIIANTIIQCTKNNVMVDKIYFTKNGVYNGNMRINGEPRFLGTTIHQYLQEHIVDRNCCIVKLSRKSASWYVHIKEEHSVFTFHCDRTHKIVLKLEIEG